MNHSHNPDDVYRLGLSLAGGATAGAYIAGVLDFLLEALLEWEAAKQSSSEHSVPPWRIALSDLAGSSAGGITAALFVAALNADFKPVPKDYAANQPSPHYNPLFSVWVDGMTYANLFSVSDLDNNPRGHVQSLLSGTFMRDVGNHALNDYITLKPLPAFARDLCFQMTVTNLRGVPYDIPHFNYGDDAQLKPRMRSHADWVTFAVVHGEEGRAAAVTDGVEMLDVSQSRQSDGWRLAVECACATAAVPFVFPTVQLTANRQAYASRGLGTPHWDGDEDDSIATAFTYAAVDGGVVNNEPDHLLVDSMQQRHGGLSRSCGAVWLIDSFPTSGTDPGWRDAGMAFGATGAATVGALLGQSSFKPIKLMDETPGDDTDNVTRFLVYPHRGMEREGVKYPPTTALACATLGAFGGILHRKLRVHDYLLGRHNCQKFIAEEFVMTRKDMLANDVFAPHLTEDGDPDEHIPIIPLTGSARHPCPVPEWPRLSKRERDETVADVEVKVEQRIDRVIATAFDNMGVTTDSGINPLKVARNAAAYGVRRVITEFVSRRFMSEVKVALEQFAYEK